MLFIQIKDGVPIEHPILEDNFIQAFPEIDINNLPSNFAVFKRYPMPEVGVYQIYEGVTYEWEGNIVRDVHHVRDMTDAEKLKKQDIAKQLWEENGFVSWIFNEESCSFHAPIEYPNDGKKYRWDEETINWVEITEA